MTRTDEYLRRIGVPERAPRAHAVRPRLRPAHPRGPSRAERAPHVSLKISMACWLVADEEARATRSRPPAARRPDGHRRRAVRGRGRAGRAPRYLDLCADIGVTRIECGEGFTARWRSSRRQSSPMAARARPRGPVRARQEARRRVHRAGRRGARRPGPALARGGRAPAGHRGARERLRRRAVRRGGPARAALADASPTRSGSARHVRGADQGEPVRAARSLRPVVHLCNVRLEELLRVEIYRRGIHSDCFVA